MTVQDLQKQDVTAANLSNVPIALLLKWLNDKLVWVEKWDLRLEKLWELEQLVQEQLNVQHIK